MGEELVSDKEKLQNTAYEIMMEEMVKMGLTLVSYHVKDIKDCRLQVYCNLTSALKKSPLKNTIAFRKASEAEQSIPEADEIAEEKEKEKESGEKEEEKKDEEKKKEEKKEDVKKDEEEKEREKKEEKEEEEMEKKEKEVEEKEEEIREETEVKHHRLQ